MPEILVFGKLLQHRNVSAHLAVKRALPFFRIKRKHHRRRRVAVPCVAEHAEAKRSRRRPLIFICRPRDRIPFNAGLVVNVRPLRKRRVARAVHKSVLFERVFGKFPVLFPHLAAHSNKSGIDEPVVEQINHLRDALLDLVVREIHLVIHLVDPLPAKAVKVRNERRRPVEREHRSGLRKRHPVLIVPLQDLAVVLEIVPGPVVRNSLALFKSARLRQKVHVVHKIDDARARRRETKPAVYDSEFVNAGVNVREVDSKRLHVVVERHQRLVAHRELVHLVVREPENVSERFRRDQRRVVRHVEVGLHRNRRILRHEPVDPVPDGGSRRVVRVNVLPAGQLYSAPDLRNVILRKASVLRLPCRSARRRPRENDCRHGKHHDSQYSLFQKLLFFHQSVRSSKQPVNNTPFSLNIAKRPTLPAGLSVSHSGRFVNSFLL